MSKEQVLVLADWSLNRDDLQVIEKDFERWQIGYSLRFVAASLGSHRLKTMLHEFEQQQGQMILLVESKPFGIENQIAACSSLPLLLVDFPVEDSQPALGYQRPIADPYNAVAYMGSGLHGLRAAAYFAAKLLAASDTDLQKTLRRERQALKARLVEYDARNGRISDKNELIEL